VAFKFADFCTLKASHESQFFVAEATTHPQMSYWNVDWVTTTSFQMLSIRNSLVLLFDTLVCIRKGSSILGLLTIHVTWVFSTIRLQC